MEHVLRPIVHSLWKISAVGVENVPTSGAFILCPNHESYLDPLWIGAALPASIRHRLTWMAMREAFENPLMRPAATQMGAAIAVDRLGDSTPALRGALEILQARQPLVIFPEGTMSRTGALGPFRRGAAWLALAVGAPLIPVRIDGGYEVYAPIYLLPRVFDWKLQRRREVRVTFGPPILPPAGARGREVEIRLTNQLREAVIALVDQ
jgi:1-acyl-sn-glycerol-3-phosphate acyltransferase